MIARLLIIVFVLLFSAVGALAQGPARVMSGYSAISGPHAVLMNAMSRAVAGGVKNWPCMLRRTGSSVALRLFLASSAVAMASGVRTLRFEPLWCNRVLAGVCIVIQAFGAPATLVHRLALTLAKFQSFFLPRSRA